MPRVRYACGCERHVDLFGTKKQIAEQIARLQSQKCWYCQQKEKTPRLAVIRVWVLACYESYKIKDELKIRGWRFVPGSEVEAAHWEWEAQTLDDLLEEARQICQLCPINFEKMLSEIDLERALAGDAQEIERARKLEEEKRAREQIAVKLQPRMFVESGWHTNFDLCVDYVDEEMVRKLKERGYRRTYQRKAPFTVMRKGFSLETEVVQEAKALLEMGVTPYGTRLAKLLEQAT